MNEKIRRAEKRVSNVDDDNSFPAQESIESLKDTLNRELLARLDCEFRILRGMRMFSRFATFQIGRNQTTHEILEAHLLENMIADRQLLARQR